MNFFERKSRDLSLGHDLFGAVMSKDVKLATKLMNQILLDLSEKLPGRNLSEKVAQMDLQLKQNKLLVDKVKLAFGYFVSTNFPDLSEEEAIEAIVELYSTSSEGDKEILVKQILEFSQNKFFETLSGLDNLEDINTEAAMVQKKTKRKIKKTLEKKAMENYYQSISHFEALSIRHNVAKEIWLNLGEKGRPKVGIEELMEMFDWANLNKSIKTDLIYWSKDLEESLKFKHKIRKFAAKLSRETLPLTFKRKAYHNPEEGRYDYHLIAKAETRKNPLGNQLLETLIKLNRLLHDGNSTLPVEYKEWEEVVRLCKRFIGDKKILNENLLSWSEQASDLNAKLDVASLDTKLTELENLLGKSPLTEKIINFIKQLNISSRATTADVTKYWLNKRLKDGVFRIGVSFEGKKSILNKFQIAFFPLRSISEGNVFAPIRTFKVLRDQSGNVLITDQFDTQIESVKMALSQLFSEILSELGFTEKERNQILIEISYEILSLLARQQTYQELDEQVDFYNFGSMTGQIDLDKINEDLKPEAAKKGHIPIVTPETPPTKERKILDNLGTLSLLGFRLERGTEDLKTSGNLPENPSEEIQNRVIIQMIKTKRITEGASIRNHKDELINDVARFWEKECFNKIELLAANDGLNVEELVDLFKKIRVKNLLTFFNESVYKNKFVEYLNYAANFYLDVLENFKYRVVCYDDHQRLRTVDRIFQVAKQLQIDLNPSLYLKRSQVIEQRNSAIILFESRVPSYDRGLDRIIDGIKIFTPKLGSNKLTVSRGLVVLDQVDQMIDAVRDVSAGKSIVLGEIAGLVERMLKILMELRLRYLKTTSAALKRNSILHAIGVLVEVQKKYSLKLPKKVLSPAMVVGEKECPNPNISIAKNYFNDGKRHQYTERREIDFDNRILNTTKAIWEDDLFDQQMSALSTMLILENHIFGEVEMSQERLSGFFGYTPPDKINSYWDSWYENNAGFISQENLKRIVANESLRASFENFVLKQIDKNLAFKMGSHFIGATQAKDSLIEIITLLKCLGLIEQTDHPSTSNHFPAISITDTAELIVKYSEIINFEKLKHLDK